MEYSEEDFLQLSGIQHFEFCRRQWALIHIENQWAENGRTTEGMLMHQNVHDEGSSETRGNTVITRGVRIFSATMGVSGACDVLEFHRGAHGITMKDREGLWQPFPVEYKRGFDKERAGDALQLCGQAMCLEEMLCCEIPCGALFYGQTRRRKPVDFTAEMRHKVKDDLREMHELYRRGTTPKVKPGKSCGACSLKELCLPELLRARSVGDYLAGAIWGTP